MDKRLLCLIVVFVSCVYVHNFFSSEKTKNWSDQVRHKPLQDSFSGSSMRPLKEAEFHKWHNENTQRRKFNLGRK